MQHLELTRRSKLAELNEFPLNIIKTDYPTKLFSDIKLLGTDIVISEIIKAESFITAKTVIQQKMSTNKNE